MRKSFLIFCGISKSNWNFKLGTAPLKADLLFISFNKLVAGLVYVLLKHFVDRYNIFFAYAPSRINKDIHTSAIYFVLAAFWVLQLTLLFFSLLRYGLYGVTIFALVGCVLTFLLVVFQAWFRRFRSLAPISYRVSQDNNLAPNRRIPSSPDDALLNEYAADASHFTFVWF